MSIAFTKMHGLGNDFVVIEALQKEFHGSPEQIRRLADRHFGIGFDQLLLVEPPASKDMDFSYRIFNADGIPHILDDGRVRVDMGVPDFEPENIPFNVDKRQRNYSLTLTNDVVEIAVVSMGNPHAVQIVDDVDSAPVTQTGPEIEHHPLFPQRVNAGYMEVVDRHAICLRVWERGSGETMACGTGACAAVAAGIDQGLLDSPVEVSLSGGKLEIEWSGHGTSVFMTGPAEYVYEGVFEMEKL
jgi:diaminopimelate epimerase